LLLLHLNVVQIAPGPSQEQYLTQQLLLQQLVLVSCPSLSASGTCLSESLLQAAAADPLNFLQLRHRSCQGTCDPA
jgi:hypothetical protein